MGKPKKDRDAYGPGGPTEERYPPQGQGAERKAWQRNKSEERDWNENEARDPAGKQRKAPSESPPDRPADADDTIRRDAIERLRREHIDTSQIEVSCDAGVVTLEGSVPDQGAKRTAEACVAEIEGVVGVRNELLLT